VASSPQPRAPILIVDDNDLTRALLKQVLELEGYPTVTASDGIEALQYLRDGNAVSLVIMDVYMPVMDGRSLAEQVRADPALAHIPVIAYSAGSDETIPGTNAFVRKSAHPDVLLGLVAKHCRGA
jgi:CheY-like chemotaxis protein